MPKKPPPRPFWFAPLSGIAANFVVYYIFSGRQRSQEHTTTSNSTTSATSTSNNYTVENYIRIETLSLVENVTNLQHIPDIQNVTNNESITKIKDLTNISDLSNVSESTNISNLPNMTKFRNITNVENTLGHRSAQYLQYVALFLAIFLIFSWGWQCWSNRHRRNARNNHTLEAPETSEGQAPAPWLGNVVNIVMVSGVDGVNANGSRLRYTQANAGTPRRFSHQQSDVADLQNQQDRDTEQPRFSQRQQPSGDPEVVTSAAPVNLAVPVDVPVVPVVVPAAPPVVLAVPLVPVVPYSCGCLIEYCRNRRCGCRKRGVPCNNGCHKGIEGHPCQNHGNPQNG